MAIAGILYFVWPLLYTLMVGEEFSFNMMVLTTAIVVAGSLAGRKGDV